MILTEKVFWVVAFLIYRMLHLNIKPEYTQWKILRIKKQ